MINDTLANKANKLEKYLNQHGLKVSLINRLKSIHGPEDDIIEIHLEGLPNRLNLLASDKYPGKFELVGLQKMYNNLDIDGDFLHKMEDVKVIGVILPEFPG